jgi:hypothetical protein
MRAHKVIAASLTALALAPAGALARGALRITIDSPGVYRVPAEEVKRAGLDLAACDLFVSTSTAVPIVEEKDGGLEFFGDPRPARHTRERSYVLRPREAGAAPVRAARVEAPGEIVVERNAFYDPLDTDERGVLGSFGEPRDYFFFGKPDPVQTYSSDLPALGGEGAEVELTLTLQGERRSGAANEVAVSWNGKRVGPESFRWNGPQPFEAKAALRRDRFSAGGNELKLEVKAGRVLLDRVAVGAPARSARAARAPKEIVAIDPPDLAAGGAEWVAITTASLAPEVERLAQYRAAHGLAARVVRLQDVFDAFSGGTFDPAAIRTFLETAAARWEPRPRYVLLCGDASYDVDWYFPRGETMPAALVDTFDNGASASDDWFVAFGADRALPAIAIGRFPARTREQCRAMVDRTIRYETAIPPGPWRRRLSFVAGEGRFGPTVDKAIEDLAVRIFNEYIPYTFDLDMTYASATSPYLYIPSRLTDKVIERLNEGCALLSYTGHGARDGFDDMRYRGKRYELFRSDDVSKVKCGAHPPIVFITACWTGCFDYPEEQPVGELLFDSPDGPVAVVAASRVSHPFANAVFSKELVAGLFGPKTRGKRLGDSLVETKRLLVEGNDQYRQMINGYGALFLQDPMLLQRLLADNMHLYSLFGDPALAPAFPRDDIEISCGKAVPGKKLEVKGEVGSVKEGKAIVTFEVARAKILGKLEKVDLAAKDAEKKIAKNYELANDKVIAKAEVAVKGGAFAATLPIPADLLPFKYYVKAFAWSKTADAGGSAEVALDFDEEGE